MRIWFYIIVILINALISNTEVTAIHLFNYMDVITYPYPKICSGLVIPC